MSNSSKKFNIVQSKKIYNEITKKEQDYYDLYTAADMHKMFGRGSYQFVFQEIKDDHLILMQNSTLYKTLIPPHWIDVELLENGCTVDVDCINHGVCPKLRDTKATFFIVNGIEDKLYVMWRGRAWLFIQNLPDQYYTVYSTIADRIYTTYDVTGIFCLKECPHPYRTVGFAPLLTQNNIKTKSLRPFPFMCKKPKENKS